MHSCGGPEVVCQEYFDSDHPSGWVCLGMMPFRYMKHARRGYVPPQRPEAAGVLPAGCPGGRPHLTGNKLRGDRASLDARSKNVHHIGRVRGCPRKVWQPDSPRGPRPDSGRSRRPDPPLRFDVLRTARQRHSEEHGRDHPDQRDGPAAAGATSRGCAPSAARVPGRARAGHLLEDAGRGARCESSAEAPAAPLSQDDCREAFQEVRASAPDRSADNSVR